MRNVTTIAIREFKATAMTKAFIFGALVLPALIWTVLVVAGAAGLFEEEPEPITGAIALIDATENDRFTTSFEQQFDPEYIREEKKRRMEAGRRELQSLVGSDSELLDMLPSVGDIDEAEDAEGDDAQTEGDDEAERLESRLRRIAASGFLNVPDPQVEFEQLDDETDVEAQQQRVRSGELLAVVVVNEDTLSATGEYLIYVGETLKAKFIDVIERATRNAIQDVRYITAGLDPGDVRRLTYRPIGEVKRTTEEGESQAHSEIMRIIPIFFAVILFMAVFTGAQYLMMSTVEEKGSRVMEVLLSAASPMQLMIGKIVGQGLVGLVIMVVYGGAGLLAAARFSQYVPQIPTWVIVLQIVYFLLAYFMFAAIFASVGAAVTEIREAQALQGPIIGAVILAFYLSIFTGMANLHGPINLVMSFIPPFSPVVMSMRISSIADPAPMWQIALSIVVGVVSVLVMCWAAAKIFRVGVLMYGKPPSLGGLIKWIRYS